jgi:hypothetical protein
VVIVALLLAGCLAQDSPADVSILVEKLGSESIQEREDATALLCHIGEPAIPDLDRALSSTDAEVVARVRGLIALIAPHRREVIREMGHLFSHACGTLRTCRFEDSVLYCNRILQIDSQYGPALELRSAAEKLRRDEGPSADFLARVEEWWADLCEDFGLLPDLGTIRYPSRASWQEIASSLPSVHPGVYLEGADFLCISRKLDTMKIDLAFENTKLDDILAFIRDFSGLNIVVDAGIANALDPQTTMTFKVKDMVLKNVLKLLLAQLRLGYVVTEEGVVLLTDQKRICHFAER